MSKASALSDSYKTRRVSQDYRRSSVTKCTAGHSVRSGTGRLSKRENSSVVLGIGKYVYSGVNISIRVEQPLLKPAQLMSMEPAENQPLVLEGFGLWLQEQC